MSLQGSENREKLLAISFLVCFYFLRGQQAMEELLFRFNLAHSFLVILFNQLSFAIPMYTLTSLGISIFELSQSSLWMCLPVFLWFSLNKLYCLGQGEHFCCKAYVQNVYAVPQLYGGNIQYYSVVFSYLLKVFLKPLFCC